MSPLILAITLALWCLPGIFVLWAIFASGTPRLLAIATIIVLVLIYGGVWVGCRPSRFLITSEQFTIAFPAWQRSLSRADLGTAHLLSEDTFREEFGWAMRIGAGGLWGGFGWLYTQKKGMLEFYVTRSDNLVWIQRSAGHDLLITPERSQDFIQVLNEHPAKG